MDMYFHTCIDILSEVTKTLCLIDKGYCESLKLHPIGKSLNEMFYAKNHAICHYVVKSMNFKLNKCTFDSFCQHSS